MLSKASTMPVSNSLFVLVVNELKEIGIKHKEKKPKIIKASVEHRLFRQGLQYLKLADAFLENGTVVQIPQFVVEACSFILEHCETEGIFRRAGSAIKQREIRKFLEAGNSLGKCHRVIDVANIVSYFFRELPEPLIPSYLHDTLVRCLLTPTTTSNTIHSMQLTCLIMPLLTVQTLAYFMQFLNTITRHVASNKMSAQNLAIVIAPSIMPYRDINSVRFKNHIKIVEMLINNASVIGNIPERIQDKLGSKSKNLLNTCLIATKKKRHECRRPLTTQMQRRSNMTREDIDEILLDRELDDDDLFEIATEVIESENGSDTEIDEHPIKAETIKQGLKLAAELENYFVANDTDAERVRIFQKELHVKI
ncbi:rho GTPase-activating protein 36-like isoform X3 [Drosophila albomicans]|uniref:Rho GTPase-activating protein 36-like isoform X3 n=1 Tax=Drosophila albomicans TaxID=7291 RepID=A0A9C6WDP5_DROAB|nr:rho GTPase-activating protein 36-like isoform X3 [Drosophila albomicans]